MFFSTHELFIRPIYRPVARNELTLGAHAQEGYGTCLVWVGGWVCVYVCYSPSAHSARLDAQSKVRTGFSKAFHAF